MKIPQDLLGIVCDFEFFSKEKLHLDILRLVTLANRPAESQKSPLVQDFDFEKITF